MEPRDLEQYLHRHIPMAAAMGLAVLEAGEDGVVLRAPLSPNINHHDSVFGGSASALAILSAWSLVHVRLRQAGNSSGIFIQHNTQTYDHPILGAFTARSYLESPEGWARFMKTLERRGRARVTVSAVLEYEGAVAGRFQGAFAALAPSVSTGTLAGSGHGRARHPGIS